MFQRRYALRVVKRAMLVDIKRLKNIEYNYKKKCERLGNKILRSGSIASVKTSREFLSLPRAYQDDLINWANTVL